MPSPPPPHKKEDIKLEEDDDDRDDVPRGGRNKNKADGNKKERARVKRTSEAITLRDQIGEMTKMKEAMLPKHWDAKVAKVKKKEKHKEEKWGRRCNFEECKIALEEKKRKDERTSEEDRLILGLEKNGDHALEEDGT
ncbi:Acid beta-fructofuranosidase [Hordeum vulgare]|nr:Acid beta-fructofuranosidase [Hordeum vulgare]